jgi:hypothetical protein
MEDIRAAVAPRVCLWNRDRETSGPHGRISCPSLRSAARQAVHAAGAGFPSATSARIQHVGPQLEDRRQSRSVRKLSLDVVRRVVRRLPEDGVALRDRFLFGPGTTGSSDIVRTLAKPTIRVPVQDFLADFGVTPA